MGSAGVAGIYLLDNAKTSATPTITAFDLTTLGLNFGTVSDNATRALSASSTSPQNDPDVFPLIGKVGIGDIEVSADGKKLYVVNLFEKKLHILDITNTLPTLISSHVIPDPGCVGGDWRPFGLSTNHGDVHVGGVCDAFTSQLTSDLKAYVHHFDGAGFTQVFTMSLNYAKGGVIGSCNSTVSGWFPWSDTQQTPCDTSSSRLIIVRPQPILSNIAFDEDGSMILDFRDRTGDQEGWYNYGLSGTGTPRAGVVAGDLIRVCKTTGAYVLQGGNGCANNFVNNEGPNGGEFYNDATTVSGNHKEISTGALVYFPPRNSIGFTTYSAFGSTHGGMRYVDADNSSTLHHYQVYASGTSPQVFGKANGLGDLELLSDPAPLQIGNRVWLDTNGNGLQDAGETGISGVTVELVQSGTVISTATTDSNGEYYFSSASGTSTASNRYGITALEPGMAYTLRFPTSATVAGTSYNLTTVKAGTHKLIDSDAAASGEVAVLATDIPVSGANNHSFDVGYASAPACVIDAPTVNVVCHDNGTPTNANDDTFTYTINATGTSVGATYSISGGDTYANRSYGTPHTSTHSFPIAGGNLTLTLTDDTTTSCKLENVSVTAPSTCSGSTPTADLELTKTANVSNAKSGDTVIYTLTVKNNGSDGASGVEVTDLLPAGITYVSHAASQGTYTSGTGLWAVGSLANGATATLTLTVTVN